MTSEEFAAIAKKDPVVSGPVGALEKHGRHPPRGGDVPHPLHVGDERARRPHPWVPPPIPYGVCTTTRPYPGTVSVSVDALKAFVRDILADFVRNGVRRVMILSGHAGREHMMALRAAAQEVVDQGTGLKATVLSDYDIIYASQGILPEGDGHAGAGETSRILTARPDLVKGKSPAGKNEIPPYAVVEDPRRYWSGVTGDPAKASRALGQKLDELVIGELVKLVEELRRRAWHGIPRRVEAERRGGRPCLRQAGDGPRSRHRIDGPPLPRRRRPLGGERRGHHGCADVPRDRGGGEAARDSADLPGGELLARPDSGRRGRGRPETRPDQRDGRRPVPPQDP